MTLGSCKVKKETGINLFPESAGGRTRTGMVSRRILSAVRLPIPPHRHNGLSESTLSIIP